MLFDSATLARAARIELLIFDVDGVLTDGKLVLGANGAEHKNFNVRDGLGMVMLRESGVAIAIITGRSSSVVSERMQSLGIDHVFQGQSDKLVAYAGLIASLKLNDAVVAYVGDDLPDVPVMRRVGLPIAVADADPRLLRYAHYQTESRGGEGAAREVCELIMAAKGTLHQQLEVYQSGDA